MTCPPRRSRELPEYVLIETTRCGGCRHLEEWSCPNGNTKGERVPSFFGDKCASFEELKK